jgi:nicotinate-nucleotide adenylyltransferase
VTLLFPSPTLRSASAWHGLRIGLLGGSFNPPHEGHLHISEVALRTLGLDCVWWLVSPQNPLKKPDDTADYGRRYDWCSALIGHNPRIVLSDLERQIGTNRTFDTLRLLLPRFPQTEFIWLAGFDNALSFHRWHRWRDILGLVATGFVARPPALQMVRKVPLRLDFGQQHITLKTAARPVLTPRTTYWITSQPMNAASSTRLRQIGSENNLFAQTAAEA